MRWFTTGVALATLLAMSSPGRAQTSSLTNGTLQGAGDNVYESPFTVTLNITQFAELQLAGFSTHLVVPNPGATGTATMLGTLNINTPCDMAVATTPITVNRTQGGVDFEGLPATYIAGPAVGNKANIAAGIDNNAFYWDITAHLAGNTAVPAANAAAIAYGATPQATDSFTDNTNALGAQTLGFDAVPLGIYDLTFNAEFTTNNWWDYTAEAQMGVTSTVTVTISPN